jgi:carbohydrate/starch-binding protein with CBM21 domain
MSDPVELRLVTSNSFPSGTGSFNYRGEYFVVVQNIAFEKQVTIQGRTPSSPTFTDRGAVFQESLPDGRELWKLTTGDEMVEFVTKYGVSGNTFFDNNSGANYKQPQVFDEFDALLGSVPQVVHGTSGFSDATHITVTAALKDLAFVKQVGILFTTNNWATAAVALGGFSHMLKSGNEVWSVNAPVGTANRVDFAIFYRVNGQEFWDNNFWRNYSLLR